MSTAAPDYHILTLECPGETAEALCDWTRDAFDVEPVILEKIGHASVWLELYFASMEEAALAQLAAKARPEVQASDLRFCPGRDWTTFWRTHFKPQVVGQRIYVCPEWEDPTPPRPEMLTLRINPGLSFGTGDHFTTRFCLEVLDGMGSQSLPASVLDAGTGSGILAMGAALLGCSRVLGVDHDPVALESARGNLRLNDLENAVELKCMDLTRDWVSERFEVVFANLYGGLLMDLAPQLLRSATRTLVLTGIREIEVDAVADVFVARGAREIRRDGDREWAGIVLDVS